MKKYILSLMGLVLFLSSCDYNDKYFDLDELTPNNKISKEITLDTKDYKAISANLANIALAKKMDAEAEVDFVGDDKDRPRVYAKALAAVGTDSFFTEKASADIFMPNFLMGKWYGADEKSTVFANYNVNSLEETGSKLFLFRNTTWMVKPLPLIDVNFEDQIFRAKVELEGWINASLEGELFWFAKSFSNNLFAECSARDSKAKEPYERESWLISPEVSISAEGYAFRFQYQARYYFEKSLTVYISTNFDGIQENIKKAEWVDVTESLGIKDSNMDALESTKTIELNDYVGKKIHIAFVYKGMGQNSATTYQVDDILVDELDFM